jgi:hypothetical protein
MPVVTLSTTGSKPVPANPKRTSLVITNLDGTATIYLKVFNVHQSAPSSTDFDFQLGPGSVIGFSAATDGLDTGSAYTAIASTGTPKLAYSEMVSHA